MNNRVFNPFTGTFDYVGSTVTSLPLAFTKIVTEPTSCSFITSSEYKILSSDFFDSETRPVFLERAAFGVKVSSVFALYDEMNRRYVVPSSLDNTLLEGYMYKDKTKGIIPIPNKLFFCAADKQMYVFDGTRLRLDVDSLQSSLTYAELRTLIENSLLIPGMQYLIEDYRTFYLKDEYPNMCEVDNLMPIIVTADSKRSISPYARLADGSAEIRVELYDDFKFPKREAQITLLGSSFIIEDQTEIVIYNDVEYVEMVLQDPNNSDPDYRYYFYSERTELEEILSKNRYTENAYSIICYAVSINDNFSDIQFDSTDNTHKLLPLGEGRYLPEIPESRGMGEILWMRDNDGNEASFDFKSIRWYFTEEEIQMSRFKNSLSTSESYPTFTNCKNNVIIDSERKLTRSILINCSENTIKVHRKKAVVPWMYLSGCFNNEIHLNPLSTSKGFTKCEVDNLLSKKVFYKVKILTIQNLTHEYTGICEIDTIGDFSDYNLSEEYAPITNDLVVGYDISRKRFVAWNSYANGPINSPRKLYSKWYAEDTEGLDPPYNGWHGGHEHYNEPGLENTTYSHGRNDALFTFNNFIVKRNRDGKSFTIFHEDEIIILDDEVFANQSYTITPFIGKTYHVHGSGTLNSLTIDTTNLSKRYNIGTPDPDLEYLRPLTFKIIIYDCEISSLIVKNASPSWRDGYYDNEGSTYRELEFIMVPNDDMTSFELRVENKTYTCAR